MGRGERKFLLEMGRSQVGFIMGRGTFLKSLYIIGRGVLMSQFYEAPLYCQLPLFHSLTPSTPHPHCSFCCSVSLAEWVMMLHLMCYFTLLNDIYIYLYIYIYIYIDNIDLHMSSLGTLVLEGP